jgi:hypothetical protein
MPQLFRNVFMTSDDVVNHTLEYKENGRYIPGYARNMVVHYANDDLAMPASKVSNLKNMTVSRRLGIKGRSLCLKINWLGMFTKWTAMALIVVGETKGPYLFSKKCSR